MDKDVRVTLDQYQAVVEGSLLAEDRARELRKPGMMHLAGYYERLGRQLRSLVSSFESAPLADYKEAV